MHTLTGLFVLAGIGLALAEGMTGTLPKNIPSDMTDGQFLQEALNYSAFQVDMGEMAARQAAGKDFINYGKDMVAAHGQIYRDLQKLAAGKGMRLAPDVDPVRQNTARVLSSEHGAAFDRNYISLMADENMHNAELYKYMEKNARDRDIRKFAGRVAPHLESYAQRAEEILTDLPFPFLK